SRWLSGPFRPSRIAATRIFTVVDSPGWSTPTFRLVVRLLRARRERPRRRRAAEQRDELTSPQLIELHLVPAAIRLTDRIQLKLRYSHHHQQPQQHSHYDELDPFHISVREPSQHFVEASHGQPPPSNRLSHSTVDDG